MVSPSRKYGWVQRLGAVVVVALITTVAAAETVTLKNGIVYRGSVDKDNTIVSIIDPDFVKRTIIRDTKIAAIGPDNGNPAVVHFPIVQPLTKHAGEMPKAAYDFKIGEWDSTGRRTFRYRNQFKKLDEMTQAIYDLGPKVCKIRGVDGFWVGQVATNTVPRSVVMGILSKVDQRNAEERIKVCRFLVQAEWVTEARMEVDRILKDFANDPAIAEKMKAARESIRESEGRALLKDIDDRRKALQPRTVASRLRTFPTEGMPAEVLASVKDQLRKDQTQAAADKTLADAVKKAADDAQVADRAVAVEILDALAQAPDAVTDRLEAFQKGLADNAKPEELYALALSGFLAGSELAVNDRKTAETMLQTRDLARKYLSSRDGAGGERAQALDSLRRLEIAASPISMALLTEIVKRMPPALRDSQDVAPGKPTLLRVRDEPNPDQPSEYAIVLPPEYSPLRSYPMVVAIHDANSPMQTLEWWSGEAARRGFVVIAPEYNLRDQPRLWRYTQSEHAAITLALRDALKRFAIDPDRVFIAGSLFGGEGAWDYGQTHPDLFAGIVAISAEPAKYVWPTRTNLARVPLYLAIGDLAPAESEVVFGEFAKPEIARNNDVTYVEYYRRGLEDFPEEAGPALEWMSVRKREPNPKTFSVVAGRECDNRFFGVVVTEFVPSRIKDPAVINIQGKGFEPATISGKLVSSSANLFDVRLSGVREVEIWVGPKHLDFSKKLEIRINGNDKKPAFKAIPKPDPEVMLEDVRVRGDRSQVYWLKVGATLGKR